jgi:asparagine synthase (glutamine-hydrolysing)
MCGIAGIVRWDHRPVTTVEIGQMCQAMRHRGPDDEGVYVHDGVGLGMRRLSILDLPGGRQPIANEDESVHIVFNGEIYNYRELRRGLERSGHRFRTAGDTETIIHLYEEHGARCVELLRGMFAFAIWDARRRMLLLARDRLGIKPLYYLERGNELIFASEVKPILSLPLVERRLNWSALNHLFAFMSTSPTSSIIDGVQKLEPARVAWSRNGSALRIERYWDVEFTPNERLGEAELVEQLRHRLDDAVRAHEVSDVPVGAFLSGGIDSSIVVATMARHASRLVKTFSVGFAEQTFNELGYARTVAQAIGTDHHELVVSPDIASLVDELTWHLDEPFGDASAIPTYLVSRLAASEVKVVLTGDGGDELFAGYDKYVVEARERPFDRVPAPIRFLAGAVGRALPGGAPGRRFLRHFALQGAHRYLDASTLFAADDRRRLFHPEAVARMVGCYPDAAWLDSLTRDRDWISAVQYSDLNTYLPLDVLTKVDRMTMAHSLEARPPLLDHLLVEFAATVPSHWRLRRGTTKYLLKQAARGLLPDAVIDRPKQGFAVPLNRWLRGPLAPMAREILTARACRERGIFSQPYVERLLRWQARGRDLGLQIWTMLSLELWCRQFLDRPAPVGRVRAQVA